MRLYNVRIVFQCGTEIVIEKNKGLKQRNKEHLKKRILKHIYFKRGKWAVERNLMWPLFVHISAGYIHRLQKLHTRKLIYPAAQLHVSALHHVKFPLYFIPVDPKHGRLEFLALSFLLHQKTHTPIKTHFNFLTLFNSPPSLRHEFHSKIQTQFSSVCNNL